MSSTWAVRPRPQGLESREYLVLRVLRVLRVFRVLRGLGRQRW